MGPVESSLGLEIQNVKIWLHQSVCDSTHEQSVTLQNLMQFKVKWADVTQHAPSTLPESHRSSASLHFDLKSN